MAAETMNEGGAVSSEITNVSGSDESPQGCQITILSG